MLVLLQLAKRNELRSPAVAMSLWVIFSFVTSVRQVEASCGDYLMADHDRSLGHNPLTVAPTVPTKPCSGPGCSQVPNMPTQAAVPTHEFSRPELAASSFVDVVELPSPIRDLAGEVCIFAGECHTSIFRPPRAILSDC